MSRQLFNDGSNFYNLETWLSILLTFVLFTPTKSAALSVVKVTRVSAESFDSVVRLEVKSEKGSRNHFWEDGMLRWRLILPSIT